MLSSLPMQHGGHSIVLRGLYALQLQPWLESFPNQIKVLSINDIKGTKSQVLLYSLPPYLSLISLLPLSCPPSPASCLSIPLLVDSADLE
jgi:hypothetical protein